MEALLILYNIKKYRTIIDILRSKESLTDDEHNLLILSAVTFNLKFDYIKELENSKVSDIVQDLNLFKSFIYNKAIEQKLIPKNSTFEGFDKTAIKYDIPIVRQVGDNVKKYDTTLLKYYSDTSDDRFIEYFNTGLDETDKYNLIYIYFYNLIYSINIKNYSQGLKSISFFSNIFDDYGNILNNNIKHFIATFIDLFSNETLDKDTYIKLLNISDDTYSRILSGELKKLDSESTEIQELRNRGEQ